MFNRNKSHRKLVYGVGINDADYAVIWRPDPTNRKLQQTCPYYEKWRGMFQRCYSEIFKGRYPTYKDCEVCPEWHHFMEFRAWMVEQEWEGKSLDKDLKCRGNKIYSPETCLFIPQEVNTFLNLQERQRGELPIGVSLRDGKFRSTIRREGKQRALGYFSSPEEAHREWLKAKLEQAAELASKYTGEVSYRILEWYGLTCSVVDSDCNKSNEVKV
jgi:hypothetical protein